MKKSWWKESIVYQIYPRSFKDSNEDGIGDIGGIIEKLDYIKHLGIDIIWLCPIYDSPNDDNGYDIRNYRDVLKEFGTLEEFKFLLEESHKRGIKILMDLVVNHTSDEHQWFVESKKSKDNKYRDYYIWKEGQGNNPPNNWGGVFGGSTWEYSEETGMYYLHCFSKKQPDLNWENPKLREDIYDTIKYWLDMGIDGFRMDVINFISKNQEFPDGEKEEGKLYGDFGKHVINGPRVHEFLKELNRETVSKYDVMTVGETPGVTPEMALDYVGEDRDELQMVFHFEHMDIDKNPGKAEIKPFDLLKLKEILSKWQTQLGDKGWNSLYWNNHDQPRIVSRFGNDKEYWEKSAKMLATCLHMQRGTPYIYQGEEIGMTNVPFPSLEYYRDIETLNKYKEEVHVKGRSVEEVMKYIHHISRDNARTPMQWNKEKNSGFTIGEPWINVNDNYKNINVEAQLEDNNSILNYYRKLIKLRKENEVIVYGKYELLLEKDKNIYAYTRELNGDKILVICNFSGENQQFILPKGIEVKDVQLLISNYPVEGENINNIDIKPYEARVYRLA